MAKVTVSVAAARDRDLPRVSVKSGGVADGFAPVTVANRRILLPLTQAEFERVADLQHRRRWAVYGGAGCLLFGLALARFPLMMPLALVIAVLSAVLWCAISFALKAYLPRMTVEGASVHLTRVHPAFVAAVGSGDS
ncbi:MAG: hypothetical protein L7U56_04120 [Acidimicrobiales bacterium]|nr:hypothetical protein [Acidimicrobiales bacterium]